MRSFAELALCAGSAAIIVVGTLAAGKAQTAASDTAAGGKAQTAIDDLKGKIFDARMAQQTFAGGLKFCTELNGKNFYFQVRNRTLNLEEYVQSLENLVKAQVFNPEKRRPWTAEDAKERWELVKKQAQEDKEKCELVQKLPELEKQLQELQMNAVAAENKQ